MRTLYLSLIFLCTITTKPMDNTSLPLITDYTCPPCDCSNTDLKWGAMGFLFGTPLCCFIAHLCLQRKKTARQIRYEQKVGLETTMHEEQERRAKSEFRIKQLEQQIEMLNSTTSNQRETSNLDPLLEIN